MIAGIYLVLTAMLGIWFGSLVDHHGKRNMMLVSSVASLILYAAALGGFLLDPDIRGADVRSITLWLFILVSMLAVIVGNIRMIALPRSEEHTSELQSLMRISYAVFCLKKTNLQTILTLQY